MPHRLVTVAYVGLVAATGWAVNHASASRSTQKLHELEVACERIGNPVRGLAQIDASDPGLARRVSPILDCTLTYVHNGGRPVRLPNSTQRDYLRILRTGRIPVVLPGGGVR